MAINTPGGASIKEYLKRAFLYRWNMLAFWGSMAGALLSPWPDALIPLLAAAELTYLSGLIASSRFRQAIDAQVYQESQQQRTGGREAARPIQEIVADLK